MDKSPAARISFAPGVSNVTLAGVDPLTPETFNHLTATEEAEKAQAAVNREGHSTVMKRLIEQAGLTSEGGEG